MPSAYYCLPWVLLSLLQLCTVSSRLAVTGTYFWRTCGHVEKTFNLSRQLNLPCLNKVFTSQTAVPKLPETATLELVIGRLHSFMWGKLSTDTGVQQYHDILQDV